MQDEIHDRGYQQGRAELHDGIDRGLARIGAGIGTTFRAIQAINFAAPWAKHDRRQPTDVGCA